MAMGTTVFRIRIELIFRRCWNLITPSRSCRGSPPNVGRAAYLGHALVGGSRRQPASISFSSAEARARAGQKRPAIRDGPSLGSCRAGRRLQPILSCPDNRRQRFCFQLIEVETKFPVANSVSEFSRSQDPQQNSRSGCLFFRTAHECSITTQCLRSPAGRIESWRRGAGSRSPTIGRRALR